MVLRKCIGEAMVSMLVTPRFPLQLSPLLKGNSRTLVKLLADPNLDRGGCVGAEAYQKERIASTDGGERVLVNTQTGSRKVHADKGQLHHGSIYVESSKGKGSRPESGYPWFCKHSQCSLTPIMGLKAEDSGSMREHHTMVVGGWPENQAMLLNSRFLSSTFTCWHRVRAWPEHAGRRNMQTSFLQSRQTYSSSCDASLLDCESMEIPPLRTSQEDEDDSPQASDNACNPHKKALKKGILPMDDLADKLFSAVTDPDSADIMQIQYQLRFRFRRTPPESFLSDLQQKAEFLKAQSLHCLPVLKTMLKKRTFLYGSPEQLQAVLNALKDFFGSGEIALSILARNPLIVTMPLERLHQMLNLIVEFQIERKVCERCCGMLTFDVDRSRRALTFLKCWGVHAACRNKMLTRDCRFLCWSVKEFMQPTLDYLESIGMNKAEILELLQVRPDILCRSVGKNLIVKHKLCQELGWNFSQAIQCITYHGYERVLSQIEFFKEQGFSDEAISELVTREPRVLAKSRENLKVKLDFFLRTYNRDMSEIIKFPACLCYSFKNRIMPRLTYLQEKGLLDSLCLSYMLSMPSSRFRSAFKVPQSVKLT